MKYTVVMDRRRSARRGYLTDCIASCKSAALLVNDRVLTCKNQVVRCSGRVNTDLSHGQLLLWRDLQPFSSFIWPVPGSGSAHHSYSLAPSSSYSTRIPAELCRYGQLPPPSFGFHSNRGNVPFVPITIALMRPAEGGFREAVAGRRRYGCGSITGGTAVAGRPREHGK